MSLLQSRVLFSLRTSRRRLDNTWSHSRSYGRLLTPHPLLSLTQPVQTIDVERSRRGNEIGYWSSTSSRTSMRHSHNGAVPFYGLPRPIKEPSTSSSGSGNGSSALLNLAQRLTAVAQDAILLSTQLATPKTTTPNSTSRWSATNTANNVTMAKTASLNQQQQQQQQDHSQHGHKEPHQNAAGANASWLQRLQLTWHFAKLAANDPTRADAVAAVGELTGRVALNTRLLSSMQRHATGRRILHERPLVSKATIPYEWLMAQARDIRNSETLDNTSSSDLTFGQAYGLFLLDHGFDPDERDGVHYLSSHLHVSKQDTEHEALLAYIMIRYRQCHDFWHVLTGLPPTVVGELGLKWLELFDTGLPSAALACTVGSLWATTTTSTTTTSSTQHENSSSGVFPRLDAQQLHDLHVIWNVYLPWARRIHQHKTATANPVSSSSSLMNVYYEEEWDTPLVDLRHRLGIEEAPQVSSTASFRA